MTVRGAAVVTVLLVACGARPPPVAPSTSTIASDPTPAKPPLDHSIKRGDLFQFLPTDATQAWFLDVAHAPPGPLFDRALSAVCTVFCDGIADPYGGDIRAAIDGVMLVGASGINPTHIAIVVSPRETFGHDFLGTEHLRDHRGVTIATLPNGDKPFDVALVNGYALFSVDGGLEPFIDRALETHPARSRFDDILADSAHDKHFWLVQDLNDQTFSITANLGEPIDVEVRFLFPDTQGASIWFHKLDAMNDSIWAALNLPETGRTFERYLRGQSAGFTTHPSLREALCLSREGVIERLGANQGFGRCP